MRDGTEDAPLAEKERRFNPWRRARTVEARAAVAEVVRLLENHEAACGLRERQRRPNDRQTMLATVEAITADLLYHHAGDRRGGVYVTRSKTVLSQRSRYRPSFYGRTLPNLLDTLAAPDLGMLLQTIGGKRTFGAANVDRTAIRPGPRMVALLGSYGLTESDFGEAEGNELVVLKRELESFWDDGGAVEYVDTPETCRFRAEVRDINAWLASADLDHDDPEDALTGAMRVDLQDRRLRRIFTRGRFDSGGRLYGGFWQGMSGARRLRSVSIEGEPVAELDYGQVGPRILYGLAGASLPDGDLYAVPGFEDHREGVKKLMSAMTFHVGPLSRFPKGASQRFPRGAKVGDVASAIASRHPALTPFFGTDIGHHVQHIESRIMVDLLLCLREEGIVGLPIHDALLIPVRRTEYVRSLMLDTFQRHARATGDVTLKEP